MSLTCSSSGLPVVDHRFLDSFALDVEGKADRYAALLRALPPGLSEWVTLIDYRPLQRAWRCIRP